MILNKKVIDKAEMENIIEDLRHIAFAEFFEAGDPDFGAYDKEAMLAGIEERLTKHIDRALQFHTAEGPVAAEELSEAFMVKLPDIVELLHSDVKAAFDGDPAAGSYGEIIVTYPGLYAITLQRFAHALYELKVPILPRLITEIAHSQTGIDIHPGAEIGERFFIDHGTGIVVGETASIGRNVKLYQGVTLGALTTRKGQDLKGSKRHPTIGDNVTIYANATVLGGDTVVGHGATIAGSTFVTASIPVNAKVS